MREIEMLVLWILLITAIIAAGVYLGYRIGG